LGTRAGTSPFLACILYFGGLAAGGIAMLFLMKPFFAPPEIVERRRSLTRRGDPLLFTFVDRLCDAMGSPRPCRIDVDCNPNASASLRRGLWSLLAGNELVLTIGLPLAARMNLQQFAGLLAHEFGHFKQGTGRSMSYLLRIVNIWFVRVVYERDQWDAWLLNTASSSTWWIATVLWFAVLCVWCSRRILWVLMWLGHVMSGYMSRQMELNADCYAVRLGGVAAFEQGERIGMETSAVCHWALAALAKFYREGRLGDNLPRLIAIYSSQMPDDVLQEIQRRHERARTHLLDTHPCDRDRIANARRDGSPGIFHLQQPASSLFTDFDDVCRKATWDFFRGFLGAGLKLADLHTIDPLLATGQ
jgi:Zn-dependent protease with chaperone function